MRVVSVAAGDPVLIAPPALAFDRHAVDYGCGHCGVDLLRTETPSRPGQLGGLVIWCVACGSHNSLD
jgi:hypothetical protein